MAEKVCLLAVPTDLVWDSKHDPQTLKSVDFWFKLSSPFVVAEPQEWCFELFRMQNSHNFLELCPRNPLGGASSTPPPPRLPSCTTVFLLATLVKKPAPPKNCWIQHWLGSNFRHKINNILGKNKLWFSDECRKAWQKLRYITKAWNKDKLNSFLQGQFLKLKKYFEIYQ